MTGATGFLGREIVAKARHLGIEVAALVRSDYTIPADWHSDPSIVQYRVDLDSPQSVSDVAEIAQHADAIIHAAGVSADSPDGAGDDKIGLTAALVQAVGSLKQARRGSPRLILVSSLSVYGYAALPNNVSLDEHTPVETDQDKRDAYCRAKLAQERLVVRAAQTAGLEARLIRVGTVYGPGRMWSARLGFNIAGWVICPGGQSLVPAVHVAQCAEALIQAAIQSIGPSDVPILAGNGRLDIINLVDPDQPTQVAWVRTIERTRVIRLPLAALLQIARIVDLAAMVVPGIERRLPTGFREATLAARFKPLRYSIARAEDRLDHRPRLSFVEAMSDNRDDTVTTGDKL